MEKIGLEAVLDMADFNKGKDDYIKGTTDMEGRTTGLSSVLGKLGGAFKAVAVAGAAIAVGAIVGVAAALKDCVNEAMEAQQAEAKLNAVLESTGGVSGQTMESLLDLAGSLQEVTMFSDETIMNAEMLAMTFTNISEDVFPQAITAATDMATVMGTDLQSAMMQLGKALNDPIEGLGALSRVGVQFTEDEKKMIEALVAAGDVMGAQELILGKLEEKFGGAAVAAGSTFAGQLTILKNQMSDVKEEIGMALLPALTSIGQALIDVLGDPAVKKVIDDIVAWLGENVPKAIEKARDWFVNELLPKVGEVRDFIRDELVPRFQDVYNFLFTKIPEAIDTAKTWLIDNLLGPFTEVTNFVNNLMIKALEALGITIGTELPADLVTGGEAWSVYQGSLTQTDEKTAALEGAQRALDEFQQTLWTGIKTTGKGAFDMYWEYINKAVGIMGELSVKLGTANKSFEEIWKMIKDNVLGIFDQLKGRFSGISEWIDQNKGKLDGLKKVFEDISGAVQWVIDRVAALIQKLSEINWPELPSWLVGHSPPPAANWMQAIADATQNASAAIANQLAPAFRMTLPAMSQTTAPAMSSSRSTTVNVNLGGVAINNGMDLAQFESTVLSTVTAAVRGYA